MTGYDIQTDDTSMDFQYWLDYVADQQRYPAHHDDAAHTDDSPLQTALRPCGNPECINSSLALYCSTACFTHIEGELSDDDSEYYHDDLDGVTLGHRATADDQAAADGDLVRRALGMPQAAPAVAAPVAQMLPEAPAAISVKLAIAGYADCILTLRDSSESRLLDRLETLLQRFQPPVVQSPPVQETGEGWCSIHCTQMRWNPAKGGEAGWWSHKQNGQWCKGRAKGQRVA